MIFFIYFWSKRFPEGVVKQLECFWGYRLWLCLVHCFPTCSLYELFGLTLLSRQTNHGYLHRQAGGDPAWLEVRAEAQEGYLPVGFAPAKWDESRFCFMRFVSSRSQRNLPGLKPFGLSLSASTFPGQWYGLLAGSPLHQVQYGFNLLVKMLLTSPRFLMFPLLGNCICYLYRSSFGFLFFF